MCARHAAAGFGAARGGSAAGPGARRLLSACEDRWAALVSSEIPIVAPPARE